MRKVLLHLLLLVIVFVIALNFEWRHDIVRADMQTYSTLPQLEKLLASNFQSRTADFTVQYNGDVGELSRGLKDLIKQALAVDDYTAYIIDSYFYSIRTWGETAKIKFTVEYRETYKQTAQVNLLVKKIINQIVTPDMNGHQKVKVIHDWIVRNVAYDQTLERYTAYDALTDKYAVCQGYALLSYKMLTAAGIPNKIVEGTVSTGDHAWNLVELGTEWYHLDLTWDDPVPDQAGEVHYNYYMKTDNEMRRDHQWTRSYPAADVSYAKTIAEAAASDSGHSAFYQKLEEDTGWIWLKPANTAATPEALQQRIKQAKQDGAFSIKVRYTSPGQVKSDVKKAMQAVRGITSYRFSATTLGSDAVLLDVTFTC